MHSFFDYITSCLLIMTVVNVGTAAKCTREAFLKKMSKRMPNI